MAELQTLARCTAPDLAERLRRHGEVCLAHFGFSNGMAAKALIEEAIRRIVPGSANSGPLTAADLYAGAAALQPEQVATAARLRAFADKVEGGQVIIRPAPAPATDA